MKITENSRSQLKNDYYENMYQWNLNRFCFLECILKGSKLQWKTFSFAWILVILPRKVKKSRKSAPATGIVTCYFQVIFYFKDLSTIEEGNRPCSITSEECRKMSKKWSRYLNSTFLFSCDCLLRKNFDHRRRQWAI